MSEKDRLIELIKESHCVETWNYHTDDFKEPNPIPELADYLLKNDVLPVVRCKDCKHYIAEYCTRDIKGRTNMFYMSPEDFCSYGIPREEGNDEKD